jgi:hypothetical protein
MAWLPLLWIWDHASGFQDKSQGKRLPVVTAVAIGIADELKTKRIRHLCLLYTARAASSQFISETQPFIIWFLLQKLPYLRQMRTVCQADVEPFGMPAQDSV